MRAVRAVRSLLAAALLCPGAAGGHPSRPRDAVPDRHPTRLTARTAVIRLLPPPPRWASPPAATLTDADTGLPVPGQAIVFTTGTTGTTGATPLCTAVTDAAGLAVCAGLRDLPYGPRQGWYRAWYAGDAAREPAGALGRMVGVGRPGPG